MVVSKCKPVLAVNQKHGMIYGLKTPGSSAFKFLNKRFLKRLPTVMCKDKIDKNSFLDKIAFWLQNLKCLDCRVSCCNVKVIVVCRLVGNISNICFLL